jgi:4-amino-4-deoxy-L-arabinose transferase-like glycosyltransferase
MTDSPQLEHAPIRGREWCALLACLALFLALRTPFIGHALFWDEAMNVCTTRSFAAGGQDAYSDWFWRHPPLYLLSLLPLRPLDAGFMERVQALTLVFWSATLLVLYRLNRRAFGPGVALLSLLGLALMPGARFFDVWIKQECLVVLFGLAALLAWEKNRPLLTGVWLGLALLSKEFGIFFAGAVFLAWLVRPRRERRWRDLVGAATVTILIAGWWYLRFSTSLRECAAFATGHAGADESDQVRAFREPWYYYVRCLRQDMGWAGFALAAGGLGCTARRFAAVWRNGIRQATSAWPLFLLLCAVPVLQFATGKAAWFLISLYGALATLQAIAAVRLWRIAATVRPRYRRGARLLLAGLAVGILAANLNLEYRELFARRFRPDEADIPIVARETAMLVSAVADPGDRILITPSRWYSERVGIIDPALVAYLPPGLNVLPWPSRQLPFDTLVTVATDARLHAVILSVDPETGGLPIFLHFRRRFGLLPLMAGNGDYLLYRTTSLWPKDP